MQKFSCWAKMMNSIKSYVKKNSKQMVSNLQTKQRKQQNFSKPDQTKKQTPIKDDKIKVSQFRKVAKTQQLNQQQRRFETSSKYRQVNKQNDQKLPIKTNKLKSIDKQAPQTDRKLTSESQSKYSHQSQVLIESIPTEKSEIIMNDIAKDVKYHQNIFLFGQYEENQSNFDYVYLKKKKVRTTDVYEIWQVEKKTAKESCQAWIMISFEEFREKWGLLSTQNAIERYKQIYNQEKNHIKNLLLLSKSNCRNSLRMIDYELKFPAIILEDNNSFSSGSIVVVFQSVPATLEQYINNPQNMLSHLDKKKIIYQICAVLADIHQSHLFVKDLSIQNFSVDKFCNIKFNSLQIEDLNCHINLSRQENNLIYCAPEQLKLENKPKDVQIFFHSGFSAISDFQRSENTPQKLNLWRFGIIVAKILTGKFIFDQKTMSDQKQKIINTIGGKHHKKSEISSLAINKKFQGLSLNEMKLLQSLLKVSPGDRISCKQLLKFNYLKNIMEDSRQNI